MVTILNVSWQRFLLVEQSYVQIGELALHCHQFAPRLFVFHDPGGQWSALVLPGEVLEHIAAQGLAYDQPVRGSSLYGLLQEGLLTVDVHRPAEEVAAHALTVDADTVLVLD